MTEKTKVNVTVNSTYTIDKRIKSGLKRLIKILIPLLPFALDAVKGIDIPYKETICVLLVAGMALEKAIQKDKTKLKTKKK